MQNQESRFYRPRVTAFKAFACHFYNFWTFFAKQGLFTNRQIQYEYQYGYELQKKSIK